MDQELPVAPDPAPEPSAGSAGDQDLLDRCVRTRSAAAFAELVTRHLSLVYGVAYRRLQDHHLAEDAAQSVFLLLARKARSLRRETVPAAWLVKAALYEASQVARRERRRREHERKAMLHVPQGGTDHAGAAERGVAGENQVPAILDEALAGLSDGDRRAVVLRYLDGLSNREAAARLNISENSCKQRVFRGLERMRRFLAGRGVTASAAALGSMLPAVRVAPPAAAQLTVKIATTAHAACAAHALAASKGALILMTTTKTKLLAAATVALLLAGTGVAIRAHLARPRAGSGPAPATAVTAGPAATGAPATVRPAANRPVLTNVPDGVERREITTTDGKKITTLAPRGAPQPGPQATYQFMGVVDPKVRAQTQPTESP